MHVSLKSFKNTKFRAITQCERNRDVLHLEDLLPFHYILIIICGWLTKILPQGITSHSKEFYNLKIYQILQHIITSCTEFLLLMINVNDKLSNCCFDIFRKFKDKHFKCSVLLGFIFGTAWISIRWNEMLKDITIKIVKIT